jgi:hypothetical protein
MTSPHNVILGMHFSRLSAMERHHKAPSPPTLRHEALNSLVESVELLARTLEGIASGRRAHVNRLRRLQERSAALVKYFPPGDATGRLVAAPPSRVAAAVDDASLFSFVTDDESAAHSHPLSDFTKR